MNQFDYDDDMAARLNSLERQLAETVAEKEAADQKYDALFLQVFHAFDQAGSLDAPASFVCEDGFKLARIIPQMSPQVDAEKLRAVCLDFGAGDTGARLWNRVTDAVRVVNHDKLAAEIKKYPALGESIDKSGAVCIPQRKPSRIRKLASKQELQVLSMKQGIREDVG